jgi:hypothetical protein
MGAETVSTATRREPETGEPFERAREVAVDAPGEWRPPLVRQHPHLMRLVFCSVWLAYLAARISSLAQRHLSGGELALALCTVVLLAGCYLVALAADVWRRPLPVAAPALLAMTAIIVSTSLAFGKDWILLCVYLGVAAVTCLPDRFALASVAATCLLAVALAAALGLEAGTSPAPSCRRWRPGWRCSASCA